MRRPCVLRLGRLRSTRGIPGLLRQRREDNVVFREDGSGTRGAFIELFGIEEKDDSGEKVDKTTSSAAITNSTAVMTMYRRHDANAIGYISLGSLDDTVKAVNIDGAAPSVESVGDGF